MSERTQLLIGPPGTGKTKTLLDVVDDALASGIPPHRIAYLAFTKKAAEEAVHRAVERFDHPRDDFVYFRTLHSLAFRELALSRDQVMMTDDFTEIGDKLGGYTFTHQYDETLERAPMYGGLGDKCLNLYSLARATRQDPKNVWMAADNPGMDWRTFHRFVRAVDTYKDQTGKLDFSDFMDQCHTTLDVDLFILDEAQDLTAQQWEFAKQAGASAPRVYIAGDDDQAIFQWAGADLTRLLQLRGHRVVLPQSYRLPRQVFNLAERLTAHIPNRFEKHWAPRDDEGVVKHNVALEQVDFSEGTWLLMTRNRHHLAKFETMCRDQGVVYKHNGFWSNQHPAVQAVLAYERLRRGEEVSPKQARLAARFAGGDLSNTQLTTFHWSDIVWPFEGKPDWMHALPRLGDEQFEYIRRLRRRGESLIRPGRVVISTIHGAKGGEADNVLLLPDISKRVYEGMLLDPSAEARVWYVGVTRAKQSLYIAAPSGRRFFQLH